VRFPKRFDGCALPRRTGKGRRLRGLRPALQAAGLAVAELGDPAGENLQVGRGEIDKLYAHADARLYDTHDRESFDDFALVRKRHARAGAYRQRLTGANEAAAEGDIGSDSGTVRARFEINQVRVGGKGITDGVATVSYASLVRLGFRGAIVHGDDVAHVSWA